MPDLSEQSRHSTVEAPLAPPARSGDLPPLPPSPSGPRALVDRRRGGTWWALRIFAVAFALLALAQAVPYGRSHTNPPVQAEPRWNSAATRVLAQRACFDCHSNLTVWKWYSNIAPMSWLIQRDVDGGRSSLNFSEWNRPQDGAGDIAGAISGGSMPPWFYVIAHPSAGLSKVDQQRLIDGLAATFRNSPPIGGGG